MTFTTNLYTDDDLKTVEKKLLDDEPIKPITAEADKEFAETIKYNEAVDRGFLEKDTIENPSIETPTIQYSEAISKGYQLPRGPDFSPIFKAIEPVIESDLWIDLWNTDKTAQDIKFIRDTRKKLEKDIESNKIDYDFGVQKLTTNHFFDVFKLDTNKYEEIEPVMDYFVAEQKKFAKIPPTITTDAGKKFYKKGDKYIEESVRAKIAKKRLHGGQETANDIEDWTKEASKVYTNLIIDYDNHIKQNKTTKGREDVNFYDFYRENVAKGNPNALAFKQDSYQIESYPTIPYEDNLLGVNLINKAGSLWSRGVAWFDELEKSELTDTKMDRFIKYKGDYKKIKEARKLSVKEHSTSIVNLPFFIDDLNSEVVLDEVIKKEGDSKWEFLKMLPTRVGTVKTQLVNKIRKFDNDIIALIGPGLLKGATKKGIGVGLDLMKIDREATWFAKIRKIEQINERAKQLEKTKQTLIGAEGAKGLTKAGEAKRLKSLMDVENQLVFLKKADEALINGDKILNTLSVGRKVVMNSKPITYAGKQVNKFLSIPYVGSLTKGFGTKIGANIGYFYEDLFTDIILTTYWSGGYNPGDFFINGIFNKGIGNVAKFFKQTKQGTEEALDYMNTEIGKALIESNKPVLGDAVYGRMQKEMTDMLADDLGIDLPGIAKQYLSASEEEQAQMAKEIGEKISFKRLKEKMQTNIQVEQDAIAIMNTINDKVVQDEVRKKIIDSLFNSGKLKGINGLVDKEILLASGDEAIEMRKQIIKVREKTLKTEGEKLEKQTGKDLAKSLSIGNVMDILKGARDEETAKLVILIKMLKEGTEEEKKIASKLLVGFSQKRVMTLKEIAERTGQKVEDIPLVETEDAKPFLDDLIEESKKAGTIEKERLKNLGYEVEDSDVAIKDKQTFIRNTKHNEVGSSFPVLERGKIGRLTYLRTLVDNFVKAYNTQRRNLSRGQAMAVLERLLAKKTKDGDVFYSTQNINNKDVQTLLDKIIQTDNTSVGLAIDKNVPAKFRGSVFSKLVVDTFVLTNDKTRTLQQGKNITAFVEEYERLLAPELEKADAKMNTFIGILEGLKDKKSAQGIEGEIQNHINVFKENQSQLEELSMQGDKDIPQLELFRLDDTVESFKKAKQYVKSEEKKVSTDLVNTKTDNSEIIRGKAEDRKLQKEITKVKDDPAINLALRDKQILDEKIKTDAEIKARKEKPQEEVVEPVVKEEVEITEPTSIEKDIAKAKADGESFEEFVEKERNKIADTKDAHIAPGFDDSPIEERLESGGDFSLDEIVKGYHNQPKDYFDANTGPRYYSYNTPEGIESNKALRPVLDGKTNVLIAYRTVPKNIVEDGFREGDWITFSKTYADNHGMARFGENEYKIIKKEVNKKDVWWDGNDINEWGFDSNILESDLRKLWDKAPAPKAEPTSIEKDIAKAKADGESFEEYVDARIESSNIISGHKKEPIVIKMKDGEIVSFKKSITENVHNGKKEFYQILNGETSTGEKISIRYRTTSDNKTIEILNLVSEAKGKGYGTELLNALIEDAKTRGIEKIIAKENEYHDALGYWESQGFMDTGGADAVLRLSKLKELWDKAPSPSSILIEKNIIKDKADGKSFEDFLDSQALRFKLPAKLANIAQKYKGGKDLLYNDEFQKEFDEAYKNAFDKDGRFDITTIGVKDKKALEFINGSYEDLVNLAKDYGENVKLEITDESVERLRKLWDKAPAPKAEPTAIEKDIAKAQAKGKSFEEYLKKQVVAKKGFNLIGDEQKYITITKKKGETFFSKLGFEQQPNNLFWKRGDTYVHYNKLTKGWHVEGELPEVKLKSELRKLWDKAPAPKKEPSEIMKKMAKSSLYRFSDFESEMSGQMFFHGSAYDFDVFDMSKLGETHYSDWGKGISLAKHQEVAQAYKRAAISGTEAEGFVKEFYIDPGAKKYDYHKTSPRDISPKLGDKLKKEGYDVLYIYDETGGIEEALVMNPKVIYNESQLKNLWSEVTHTAPTPVPAPVAEATYSFKKGVKETADTRALKAEADPFLEKAVKVLNEKGKEITKGNITEQIMKYYPETLDKDQAKFIADVRRKLDVNITGARKIAKPKEITPPKQIDNEIKRLREKRDIKIKEIKEQFSQAQKKNTKKLIELKEQSRELNKEIKRLENNIARREKNIKAIRGKSKYKKALNTIKNREGLNTPIKTENIVGLTGRKITKTEAFAGGYFRKRTNDAIIKATSKGTPVLSNMELMEKLVVSPNSDGLPPVMEGLEEQFKKTTQKIIEEVKDEKKIDSLLKIAKKQHKVGDGPAPTREMIMDEMITKHIVEMDNYIKVRKVARDITKALTDKHNPIVRNVVTDISKEYKKIVDDITKRYGGNHRFLGGRFPISKLLKLDGKTKAVADMLGTIGIIPMLGNITKTTQMFINNPFFESFMTKFANLHYVLRPLFEQPEITAIGKKFKGYSIKSVEDGKFVSIKQVIDILETPTEQEMKGMSEQGKNELKIRRRELAIEAIIGSEEGEIKSGFKLVKDTEGKVEYPSDFASDLFELASGIEKVVIEVAEKGEELFGFNVNIDALFSRGVVNNQLVSLIGKFAEEVANKTIKIQDPYNETKFIFGKNAIDKFYEGSSDAFKQQIWDDITFKGQTVGWLMKRVLQTRTAFGLAFSRVKSGNLIAQDLAGNFTWVEVMDKMRKIAKRDNFMPTKKDMEDLFAVMKSVGLEDVLAPTAEQQTVYDLIRNDELMSWVSSTPWLKTVSKTPPEIIATKAVAKVKYPMFLNILESKGLRSISAIRKALEDGSIDKEWIKEVLLKANVDNQKIMQNILGFNATSSSVRNRWSRIWQINFLTTWFSRQVGNLTDKLWSPFVRAMRDGADKNILNRIAAEFAESSKDPDALAVYMNLILAMRQMKRLGSWSDDDDLDVFETVVGYNPLLAGVSQFNLTKPILDPTFRGFIKEGIKGYFAGGERREKAGEEIKDAFQSTIRTMLYNLSSGFLAPAPNIAEAVLSTARYKQVKVGKEGFGELVLVGLKALLSGTYYEGTIFYRNPKNRNYKGFNIPDQSHFNSVIPNIIASVLGIKAASKKRLEDELNKIRTEQRIVRDDKGLLGVAIDFASILFSVADFEKSRTATSELGKMVKAKMHDPKYQKIVGTQNDLSEAIKNGYIPYDEIEKVLRKGLTPDQTAILGILNSSQQEMKDGNITFGTTSSLIDKEKKKEEKADKPSRINKLDKDFEKQIELGTFNDKAGSKQMILSYRMMKKYNALVDMESKATLPKGTVSKNRKTEIMKQLITENASEIAGGVSELSIADWGTSYLMRAVIREKSIAGMSELKDIVKMFIYTKKTGQEEAFSQAWKTANSLLKKANEDKPNQLHLITEYFKTAINAIKSNFSISESKKTNLIAGMSIPFLENATTLFNEPGMVEFAKDNADELTEMLDLTFGATESLEEMILPVSKGGGGGRSASITRKAIRTKGITPKKLAKIKANAIAVRELLKVTFGIKGSSSLQLDIPTVKYIPKTSKINLNFNYGTSKKKPGENTGDYIIRAIAENISRGKTKTIRPSKYKRRRTKPKRVKNPKT